MSIDYVIKYATEKEFYKLEIFSDDGKACPVKLFVRIKCAKSTSLRGQAALFWEEARAGTAAKKQKRLPPDGAGAVRIKNQIVADLPRIFFKVLISRGISNSIITTQPQKFDQARAEKLFFMMLIKI